MERPSARDVLRWHGVELAAITAAALAWGLVPYRAMTPLWFGIFGWFLYAKTPNVLKGFSTPIEAEWLLACGATTRAMLCRRYLFHLVWRSVVHAAGLTFVAVARTGEGDALYDWLVPYARPFGIFAWFLGLQLAMRGAIGIVRHVGSCTLLPQPMRGIANRSWTGIAGQLAFLQDVLLYLLPALPLALGIALHNAWPVWAAVLIIVPMLSAMILSCEAVYKRAEPALRWAELLHRKGSSSGLRARKPSRALGLLWTGLKPHQVRVMGVGLVAALGCSIAGFETIDRDGPMAVPLVVIAIFAFFVAAAAAWTGCFVWESEGGSATYLYGCGINHGYQRRLELASGALFVLVLLTYPTAATIKFARPAAACLLPMFALLLLRGVRDKFRMQLEVREYAGRLFISIWIIVALISFGLRSYRSDLGPFALLDQIPLLVVPVALLLTLAGLAVWVRAWVRSGDEGLMKEEIHG